MYLFDFAIMQELQFFLIKSKKYYLKFSRQLKLFVSTQGFKNL